MAVCDKCGGEVEFRYMNGRPVPMHVSGACAVNYKISSISGECYPTTCPKCSDEVFFIRHNGGSVWINPPLGQPWERHSCFDEANKDSDFFEFLKENVFDEHSLAIVKNCKSTTCEKCTLMTCEKPDKTYIHVLHKGGKKVHPGDLVFIDHEKEKFQKLSNEYCSIYAINKSSSINTTDDNTKDVILTKCLICNDKFNSYQKLIQHCMLHHFGVAGKNLYEAIYYCLEEILLFKNFTPSAWLFIEYNKAIASNADNSTVIKMLRATIKPWESFLKNRFGIAYEESEQDFYRVESVQYKWDKRGNIGKIKKYLISDDDLINAIEDERENLSYHKARAQKPNGRYIPSYKKLVNVDKAEALAKKAFQSGLRYRSNPSNYNKDCFLNDYKVFYDDFTYYSHKQSTSIENAENTIQKPKKMMEEKIIPAKTEKISWHVRAFKIGEKVNNEKYGEGQVIEVSEKYLRIQFKDSEKTMSPHYMSRTKNPN